jgi:hypothetical protein
MFGERELLYTAEFQTAIAVIRFLLGPLAPECVRGLFSFRHTTSSGWPIAPTRAPIAAWVGKSEPATAGGLPCPLRCAQTTTD